MLKKDSIQIDNEGDDDEDDEDFDYAPKQSLFEKKLAQLATKKKSKIAEEKKHTVESNLVCDVNRYMYITQYIE